MDFIIDNLDGVEETFHGAYEQQEGGKYHLNADKYAELKASGLKTNSIKLKQDLDRARQEREALKKKYEGITDEEIEAFKAKKEAEQLGADPDDKTKKPEDLAQKYQQQLTAERQRLQAAKDQEIQAKDKDIAEWKGKYEQERLSNRLKELAANAGVFTAELQTYVEFLIYKGHYKLNENDDVVFIEDGTESVISADKAMSEKLRERYPRFYESATQGGSGSQGSKGNGRKDVDWKNLSPTERMAYGRKQKART